MHQMNKNRFCVPMESGRKTYELSCRALVQGGAGQQVSQIQVLRSDDKVKKTGEKAVIMDKK